MIFFSLSKCLWSNEKRITAKIENLTTGTKEQFEEQVNAFVCQDVAKKNSNHRDIYNIMLSTKLNMHSMNSTCAFIRTLHRYQILL